MARFAFAMAAFAGIGALIAFTTLLGVQVTAQQQTTQAENHHPNSIVAINNLASVAQRNNCRIQQQ